MPDGDQQGQEREQAADPDPDGGPNQPGGPDQRGEPDQPGGPDPDGEPDQRGEPDPSGPGTYESERRRRRAQFLRELNEAKALRERVKPRTARAARMRQQMRMRTFRW